MLAMVVNDDAGSLTASVGPASIASKLAPTEKQNEPSVSSDIPRYKLDALFTFQPV
ncbi:hypothetical protein NTD84_06195 [Pseudomonas sp. 14P_8.1_Bac3]|uniref:hypothetical protein n=1 Tax=Pseudomonas sp. 14P_8.1_Bac3 TaxID=2971621 RepID=UPI0021C6FD48|nr:hypothetical protein [Pseudomonas sp. 14P_8.1_Bac3]MCU1759309.1 hypothetical protein [Pseudomonas sp. 14P_8.1_Bac3]